MEYIYLLQQFCPECGTQTVLVSFHYNHLKRLADEYNAAEKYDKYKWKVTKAQRIANICYPVYDCR